MLRAFPPTLTPRVSAGHVADHRRYDAGQQHPKDPAAPEAGGQPTTNCASAARRVCVGCLKPITFPRGDVRPLLAFSLMIVPSSLPQHNASSVSWCPPCDDAAGPARVSLGHMSDFSKTTLLKYSDLRLLEGVWRSPQRLSSASSCGEHAKNGVVE